MKKRLPLAGLAATLLALGACEKEEENVPKESAVTITSSTPAHQSFVKIGDKVVFNYTAVSRNGWDSIVITRTSGYDKIVLERLVFPDRRKQHQGSFEYTVRKEDHAGIMDLAVRGHEITGLYAGNIKLKTPLWGDEFTGRIFNNYVGKPLDSLQGFDLRKNTNRFSRNMLAGSCTATIYAADSVSHVSMLNYTAATNENTGNSSFVHGWKSHACNGTKFLKVTGTVDFDATRGRYEWNEVYSKNETNETTFIRDAVVGDVFLVIDGSTPYRLVKVTRIADDGTAANNADYIEFAYKTHE